MTTFMMMSLTTMATAPLTAVTWKPAVTSTRRYEEGYNIYSEPYARWLLKKYPKETPNDWITRLNKIEKGISEQRL